MSTKNVNCLGPYQGYMYAGVRDTSASTTLVKQMTDGGLVDTGLAYSTGSKLIPRALMEYDGNLYLAGDLGIIYVYDGTSWSLSVDSGGVDHYVDLAVYDDKLFAINTVGLVKEFDGTSWSTNDTPGASLGTRLQVYNGNLYAMNTDTVNRVRQYDGTSWTVSTVFGGAEADMNMCLHGGKLFASSGAELSFYDGTTWVVLSDNDTIVSMISYKGQLIMIDDSGNLTQFDFVGELMDTVYATTFTTVAERVRVYGGRLYIPRGANDLSVMSSMPPIFIEITNQTA